MNKTCDRQQVRFSASSDSSLQWFRKRDKIERCLTFPDSEIATQLVLIRSTNLDKKTLGWKIL